MRVNDEEGDRAGEVGKTLDVTMVKAVSPGKVGNNGETTRSGVREKVEMVREKTRMMLRWCSNVWFDLEGCTIAVDNGDLFPGMVVKVNHVLVIRRKKEAVTRLLYVSSKNSQ
ncbi:hypothetical protein LXL04_037756 [Taraxacum kok-saghyz]